MWPRIGIVLLVGLVVGCSAGTRLRSTPSTPVTAARMREQRVPGSDVTFPMVWIESGGFWMGQHEVTWDEYLVWCRFDQALPAGVDAVSRPSKPLDVHPYDRNWGAGRRPAVGMSWAAAQGYCAWLCERTGAEFRLPTEAEWRLAAGPPPKPSELSEVAWFRDNSAGKTQPVAQKAVHRNGLHDAFGNLWEYCGNPFSADQPERAVLRGGSWKDGVAELTTDARLAFDDDWTLDDPGFPPGVWWVPDGDHLGFRVLLQSTQEP